ncbi:hypothetical protein Ait01nite_088240 [Actinoplanes italicus]|nr:hypothetical protein Ait01nite_088240 [Actinoplanes italicus]
MGEYANVDQYASAEPDPFAVGAAPHWPDYGFAPLDDTGTQLLARIVAAAYERRARLPGSWTPTAGRF